MNKSVFLMGVLQLRDIENPGKSIHKVLPESYRKIVTNLFHSDTLLLKVPACIAGVPGNLNRLFFLKSFWQYCASVGVAAVPLHGFVTCNRRGSKGKEIKAVGAKAGGFYIVHHQQMELQKSKNKRFINTLLEVL